MALEKATITNTVTGDAVPVMFNPTEYSLNRDVTYAQTAIPGLSAPLTQFVNGNARTLEMELFLDTYEAHSGDGPEVNAAGDDVRDQVAKLTDLMEIDSSTHAPPVLLFVWGSLSFTCVLARAAQRFTMFLADGTPVRATVQVSFNEYRNVDLEAKEIKRETSDYSKTHIVRQGETLSSIAYAAYGDPTVWRAIARRSDIADPRTLTVGQTLVLPRLPYRDPETGQEHSS